MLTETQSDYMIGAKMVYIGSVIVSLKLALFWEHRQTSDIVKKTISFGSGKNSP